MKKVLFIAGDSTAQSYAEDAKPQTGWGEWLLAALRPNEEIKAAHRENCPFAQELRYESESLVVDNCAMAGRSSKTFREEGRLEDIQRQLKEGDVLLIQFGHNDASSTKPERYVSLEDFPQSLQYYIEVAKAAKAKAVLLSSIALCPCPENTTGEVGEIGRLLPLYAEEMKKLAENEGVLYIDLGARTRKKCQETAHAEVLTWYKEDHVHLVESGARCYAELLAEALREKPE
ncbi:MAG: GDSL-type esterase/lipase family protein [bacterium]|nr:GDSL-type esterase/lipase family protein [bacterium]